MNMKGKKILLASVSFLLPAVAFGQSGYGRGSMDSRCFSPETRVVKIRDINIANSLSLKSDDAIFTSTPTRLYSGNLLVGNSLGQLYWVKPNGSSLKLVASKNTGGAIKGGISVYPFSMEVNGDTILKEYVALGSGKKLLILDSNGKTLSSRATSGDVVTTPAIAADGKAIFGSEDNYLYYQDVVNGAPAKQVRTATDGTSVTQNIGYAADGAIVSSATIDKEGTVIFGSNDKKVHFTTGTGQKLGSISLNGEVHGTPALTGDGNVVVGTVIKKGLGLEVAVKNEGAVYFIDKKIENGKFIAGVKVVNSEKKDGTRALVIHATKGSVEGSPAVDPSNDNVVVGSMGGVLYIFNQNGQKKREIQLNGAVYASPVIKKDGTIIVATTLGKIYYFNKDGGLIAEKDLSKDLGKKVEIKASPIVYEENGEEQELITTTSGQLHVLNLSEPRVKSSSVVMVQKPCAPKEAAAPTDETGAESAVTQ